jgi:ketosteroid isomerase-like protein
MLEGVSTLAVLLGAALAATTAASEPGDRRPQDRDAIRAHIDEIFRAYMRRDRDTVRATHAVDWRGFIRPSRGVVRGIEQYMQEAEAILGAPGRLAGYEILEFDVLFHGDTALVPYLARVDWEEEGVRSSEVLRIFDVYARRDGHWNQMGSQVAVHPDTLDRERQHPRTLAPAERQALLSAREAVWRAYFAGDVSHLETALPAELVAINAGEEAWPERSALIEGARAFARSGRLIRLEFPRTEIRAYGDVAVLYTSYAYEIESGGQRQVQKGRGTEVFVHRDGRWVNPGWHLDSGR